MRKINYIVIHHTSTIQPNLDKLVASVSRSHKTRKLHTKVNSLGYYVAYHLMIGYKGEMVQTRGYGEVGYHASNKVINAESIGIALSGNFDTGKPTQAQIEKLVTVVLGLKKKFGQHVKVVYHRDFAAKTCPGKNFPYILFTKLITMASKFKAIFEKEVTEPIFTIHGDNTPATIADIKYLIEIGLARATKKIYKYVNEENVKDRSFAQRFLSFFKN